MKSFYLLLFLGTACGSIFAQRATDTTYFDIARQKTDKEHANSYRVSERVGNHYWVTDHYKNGVLKMSGEYSSLDPELKDGVFTYYSLTGQPEIECTYQNDKLEGEYRSYKTTYNMGSDSVWLWRTKNYRDGKLDGSFVTYDQAKRVRRQDLYRADKLVEGSCFDEHGEKIAYYPPDEMPQFQGGEYGLARFLQTNIVYPTEARSLGIEGKVYLNFIVDEYGNVGNVRVIRGVEEHLDAESIRIVKKMPRWTPGTEEGKPVKVSFNLPIQYKLN